MATGLAPCELERLEADDPDVFAALQASTEWNIDRELAAATLELQVLILRAIAATAGTKDSKLPKPLNFPRPTSWTAGAPKRSSSDTSPPMLTGSGLASWLNRRTR